MNGKDPILRNQSSLNNLTLIQVLSKILVSLMVTCLVVSICLFSQQIAPGANLGFLPILTFLVTLEQVFTYPQTKKIQVFSIKWFQVHSTRWVVILLVVKVMQLFLQRPESLWIEIQLWRLDFQSNFLDTGYWLSVTLTFIVWTISGLFAQLLDEMSLEESMVRYDSAVILPSDHPPARERLLNLIFGLGFFLVILTALMRIDLRSLFQGEMGGFDLSPLPYLAAGGWNVLLYFLLGLVLMSLSHFARLNMRWYFQKLELSPQFSGRWFLYSLSFIVIVAFIASLLPTNYSFGFLNLLFYILKFMIGILLFIFGIFWSLLLFLINLLISILGADITSGESQPLPTFAPPEVPIEVNSMQEESWLAILKTVLFWVIFLIVIGFSLIQFARQHEELMSTIQKIPGLAWISQAWKWLRNGFKGFKRQIADAVNSSLTRFRTRQVPQSERSLRRFLSIRGLSPHQKVYFFFLAMVRRCTEKGITRRGSQTPYEFSKVVKDVLPEVDEQVTSLTSAFVEARYSLDEIDETKAGLVKHYWARIRRVLRSYIG